MDQYLTSDVMNTKILNIWDIGRPLIETENPAVAGLSARNPDLMSYLHFSFLKIFVKYRVSDKITDIFFGAKLGLF